MIKRKSLTELSLDITEEEYRKDPSLSYSTLAKYERSGFEGLATLFDRIDTPSLTFGSAVDSIITGGYDEFNDRFIVIDLPSTPDNVIKIVKEGYSSWKDNYHSLLSVPNSMVLQLADKHSYQPTYKDTTRINNIKEKGSAYYEALFLAGDKTILDNATYNDVLSTVNALKNSPITKHYFEDNNPFDDTIERYYQLKFKATFNGIDYRCMMDEVIVDHSKKKIYLIDLKTSGKPEYKFANSFVDWDYQIQGRLYYRIFEENIKKDDYYKDFELEPYRFIVVNRKTLNPLIWKFDNTTTYGEIEHSKGVWRDPFTIGEELSYYLEHKPVVPKGIQGTNNIEEWL